MGNCFTSAEDRASVDTVQRPEVKDTEARVEEEKAQEESRKVQAQVHHSPEAVNAFS